MAYAHKRICSLSSDFVVVKMKRANAEKRAFDSKSGYNTNTNVLKSLHNSSTPPVLCCLFLLTGFSPAFLKLPSFAHTETRGHKSFTGNKRLSEAWKPNAVHVLSAGAKKGLKSHQPLRMFLLRLNWPEPLHIKLQKKRAVQGGRLGVEIDTNRPLLPLTAYSDLAFVGCLLSGVDTQAVNSEVLTACDCLEGKWEDLTLLGTCLCRADWVDVVYCQAISRGKQWPLLQTRVTQICLTGSKPETCGLKCKTSFWLLAQSKQPWMENIYVLQLVLWSGFSSHGWPGVGADVCIDDQRWLDLTSDSLLCVFSSVHSQTVWVKQHGFCMDAETSDLCLQLQTERGHSDTCAPLGPAGKGKCVFWGS